VSAAAARLQSLHRLRRLGTLRQQQAQRLLLAARCQEFAAESEHRRITLLLEGLRAEESSVARQARNTASMAALQAAQQHGAQLRREAEAAQVQRLAAEQQWRRCRAERERAGQRWRVEQARQDWLVRACRQAQAQRRMAQAAAGDAAAVEIAGVRRAMA
jgi:hypothetical protein